MKPATLLACMTTAFACLSASTAAGSIEAARAAYSDGAFVEAADLGAALGTSEGHALAAKALAIYAHFIAEEEGKEKGPLLERAMRAARTAIELDPTSAQAHLQSAHAIGRYSQLFSPLQSMRNGYPKTLRALIERSLELDPRLPGAHLSLAAWHAGAIGHAGAMAARLVGANRKTAFTHFEQAMALAPDQIEVLIEYASGLLHLERRKGRERAREMLERAIELPAQDAYERILQQLAIDRLATLEGEATSR